MVLVEILTPEPQTSPQDFFREKVGNALTKALDFLQSNKPTKSQVETTAKAITAEVGKGLTEGNVQALNQATGQEYSQKAAYFISRYLTNTQAVVKDFFRKSTASIDHATAETIVGEIKDMLDRNPPLFAQRTLALIAQALTGVQEALVPPLASPSPCFRSTETDAAQIRDYLGSKIADDSPVIVARVTPETFPGEVSVSLRLAGYQDKGGFEVRFSTGDTEKEIAELEIARSKMQATESLSKLPRSLENSANNAIPKDVTLSALPLYRQLINNIVSKVFTDKGRLEMTEKLEKAANQLTSALAIGAVDLSGKDTKALQSSLAVFFKHAQTQPLATKYGLRTATLSGATYPHLQFAVDGQKYVMEFDPASRSLFLRRDSTIASLSSLADVQAALGKDLQAADLILSLLAHYASVPVPEGYQIACEVPGKPPEIETMAFVDKRSAGDLFTASEYKPLSLLGGMPSTVRKAQDWLDQTHRYMEGKGDKPNLLLIEGQSGAGKTGIARALAADLALSENTIFWVEGPQLGNEAIAKIDQITRAAVKRGRCVVVVNDLTLPRDASQLDEFRAKFKTVAEQARSNPSLMFIFTTQNAALLVEPAFLSRFGTVISPSLENTSVARADLIIALAADSLAKEKRVIPIAESDNPLSLAEIHQIAQENLHSSFQPISELKNEARAILQKKGIDVNQLAQRLVEETAQFYENPYVDLSDGNTIVPSGKLIAGIVGQILSSETSSDAETVVQTIVNETRQHINLLRKAAEARQYLAMEDVERRLRLLERFVKDLAARVSNTTGTTTGTPAQQPTPPRTAPGRRGFGG